MPATRKQNAARQLEVDWNTDRRWAGIERPYSAEDVIKLRGSIHIEHTLARRGAERLWNAMTGPDYVRSFGALTGAQAVQMANAGLEAIYLSGWQVAADANLAAQTYPDQSLYPANSVPALVERLNNALLRADQIHWAEGKHDRDWLLPIVADAEAGFGGPLHAFELMKSMIAAGAAAVHFEDQLAAEKKMRPSRRQGSRTHIAIHPDAGCCAARGRRRGRSDTGHCAYRCAFRDAADQ